MQLSNLTPRRIGAAAAVLALGLAAGACSDDAIDAPGQVEPSASAAATADAEASAGASEATGDVTDASGDITGRVGAKFKANVFTLIGSDVAEGEKVLVVTDGSTEIHTADTVTIDGEAHAYGDAEVEEALGEDYATFQADWQDGTVVVASSVSVKE